MHLNPLGCSLQVSVSWVPEHFPQYTFWDLHSQRSWPNLWHLRHLMGSLCGCFSTTHLLNTYAPCFRIVFTNCAFQWYTHRVATFWFGFLSFTGFIHSALVINPSAMLLCSSNVLMCSPSVGLKLTWTNWTTTWYRSGF